ncbi:FAD-binding oxidoreductase [Actimicrobium sp. CCC2.4]|uniref:globin domain-containing protein n=1 Tax=Actimicrobium sp. CCC2.4 TaxID=3048606 RepID=UPI002AC922A9|nr:globin domain-containing protein [Actimicrobium sp. CCC2.4]MEB0136362.1 FAD-binding oxidoreductase [Actimicrobium sp. CCC2.4]WPX31181.1 globin domain-containing protein [Actimicrobium sp. CCC2.4]
MISTAARPYIDASVPVLRAHGLAITTTFYRNMFVAHPELTHLFNMGNQASGAQQQSLAAAVFAYAVDIGKPDALGPVIERIVQKHMSVGIRAGHYPIVGRYLIAAIKEILGDAATAPLLGAWVEAYDSLANVFIAAEKKGYAEAGITPGALRALRVIQRHTESADVDAFTLEPVDGLPLAACKPGQYISIAVDFADGRHQLRQYSLSDAPTDTQWRITVKRDHASEVTPAGEVSNWIHDHVLVGSTVLASHPFGEFVPETDSADPIVLLSAGVGITPMIATLNRIVQVRPERRVIFAHAARDPAHHAHQRDIVAAQALMPHLSVVTFYEMPTDDNARPGLMDIAALPDWPHANANVYLCGPIDFMKAQWLALVDAGVPVTRLHREVFGPDLLDMLN